MITTAITNDRFTWCLRVERKSTIFALFSDSKQVILAGTASLIPIVIPLVKRSPTPAQPPAGPARQYLR